MFWFLGYGPYPNESNKPEPPKYLVTWIQWNNKINKTDPNKPNNPNEQQAESVWLILVTGPYQNEPNKPKFW